MTGKIRKWLEDAEKELGELLEPAEPGELSEMCGCGHRKRQHSAGVCTECRCNKFGPEQYVD